MKNNKGSITIEASISLVFFIFAMVAILSVINVCRVQTAIGNALNLSAEEISQYCYFYQVCGLDTLSNGLAENGEAAAGTIDKTITDADTALSNVEMLYKLLGKEANEIKNLDPSTLTDGDEISNQLNHLQDVYNEAATDAGQVSASVKSIWGTLKEVKDDPISFVKSLVSLGLSSGFTKLKSYVVGAVMGKKFMCRHLGDCTDSTTKDYTKADEYLRQLGVVDGLDGLNFNLSTMMSPDSSQDVNLVVVYQVEILPGVFEWTATFAQSASTRAWLAGDLN